MSFKYIMTIFITLIIKLQRTISSISVVDKGMIPLQAESIGIQFYITVENLDTLNTYDVHIRPKKCCRLDSGKEDCRRLAVYGLNHKYVEPKDIETLIIVYPAIYKHNHMGYCNLLLESHCRNKKPKREVIYLPFSTNIADGSSIFKKTKVCETDDQDPLDDCSPVNCDEKYLGLRPFYSTANRCTEAPICVRDFAKDLPDVVYVPNSNICRDLDNPISVGDLYSFSTGLGVVKENFTSNTMTVQLKSNLSTISENLLFLKDLMYGKLCVMSNDVSVNYNGPCKSALWAIFAFIFGLTAVLLSFVCCVNTSVWIYKKWSSGNLGSFFSKIFSNQIKCQAKVSKVNRDVKNKLLQDVLATDLPIELRENAINLCERINKEVRKKKRYRADTVTSVLKSELSTSSETSSKTSDDNS